MLPSSIMTFMSFTQQPSTPLSVLVARDTACCMASSKPCSEMALSSVTLAMFIGCASPKLWFAADLIAARNVYCAKSLAAPFLSLAVPLRWSERPSAFLPLSPVSEPPASFARPLALSRAPSALSLLLSLGILVLQTSLSHRNHPYPIVARRTLKRIAQMHAREPLFHAVGRVEARKDTQMPVPAPATRVVSTAP